MEMTIKDADKVLLEVRRQMADITEKMNDITEKMKYYDMISNLYDAKDETEAEKRLHPLYKETLELYNERMKVLTLLCEELMCMETVKE